MINVSSVASSATPPNSAIYTGTKGAVDAITRALAKEFGPRKIRINAVNPGGVETEGFHALGFREAILKSKWSRRRRSAASGNRRTSLRWLRFSLHQKPNGSPAKPSVSQAASVKRGDLIETVMKTSQRTLTHKWRQLFRRRRRRHDPMLVLNMSIFNFADGWKSHFQSTQNSRKRHVTNAATRRGIVPDTAVERPTTRPLEGGDVIKPFVRLGLLFLSWRRSAAKKPPPHSKLRCPSMSLASSRKR